MLPEDVLLDPTSKTSKLGTFRFSGHTSGPASTHRVSLQPSPSLAALSQQQFNRTPRFATSSSSRPSPWLQKRVNDEIDHDPVVESSSQPEDQLPSPPSLHASLRRHRHEINQWLGRDDFADTTQSETGFSQTLGSDGAEVLEAGGPDSELEDALDYAGGYSSPSNGAVGPRKRLRRDASMARIQDLDHQTSLGDLEPTTDPSSSSANTSGFAPVRLEAQLDSSAVRLSSEGNARRNPFLLGRLQDSSTDASSLLVPPDFSPHRHRRSKTYQMNDQRFIRNGLASDVRDWILQSSASTSFVQSARFPKKQAQAPIDVLQYVRIEQLRSSHSSHFPAYPFVHFIRGQTSETLHEKNPGYWKIILIGDANNKKQQGEMKLAETSECLNIRTIVGLKAPIWEVFVLGEMWRVTINWIILEEKY